MIKLIGTIDTTGRYPSAGVVGAVLCDGVHHHTLTRGQGMAALPEPATRHTHEPCDGTTCAAAKTVKLLGWMAEALVTPAPATEPAARTLADLADGEED